MEYIAFPERLETFLFMGCWNRDGCQKIGGQAAVAAAIRGEPTHFPLFLGGDNIYPDKSPTTKRKTYPAQRLLQGINCLVGAVPRPLFAAIGNHNLPLLPTEFQAPWILPATSYRVDFANVSVLVLDSNAWDTGTEEEARSLLELLKTELASLRTRDRAYYCIMHHPIVSYKKKGIQVLPHYAAVLDEFVKWKPRILLVADTHNYQKGIIEWKGMDLLQIVSGTGGADLDPMEFQDHMELPVAYRLLEGMVSYGYQRIHGLSTQFIECPTQIRSHSGM